MTGGQPRSRILILLALVLPLALSLTCMQPTVVPTPTLRPTLTPTPKPITLSFSLVGRNVTGGYPELFTFAIGDDEYTVSIDGKGLRSGKSGPALFSLPMTLPLLGVESVIENPIGYTVYKGNILLIYEAIVYGSTSEGFVILLDAESLSTVWYSVIPAFNVGLPLFYNDYLYVTGIGFVGKLDLKNGAYVWKHEGLYDNKTQDFNSFKIPIAQDGRIVFQGVNPVSASSKRVEVNDRTGEILGVYVTENGP
jgi:outer membrane protein assembly factor BamB